MSKKSLNGHLVTYYTDKKISPQLRGELVSLIEESGRKRVEQEKVRFQLWPSLKMIFSSGRLAYLTVLLLLGYVAWMVNGLSDHRSFQPEITAAISREIEMNHSKKFRIEFEEHTLAGLAKQMDKLDFPLLMPASLEKSMSILGARYCSIRGRIAAQIQMVDSNGRYCTLYQTKLVEPLTSIEKTRIYLDNVEYLLWHEKGVFFGFAGPSE